MAAVAVAKTLDASRGCLITFEVRLPVTIGGDRALPAPAAHEITDRSVRREGAIVVVLAAQAYFSIYIANGSSRRAPLHVRAREDAGVVRAVRQADLACLAVARDIALHTAIECEIAYTQDRIQAIGVTHARHADARGSIRERAMQARAQVSAVALVAALAEKNPLVVAVGSCVGPAASTCVASIRVEKAIRVESDLRERHGLRGGRGVQAERGIRQGCLPVERDLRVERAGIGVVEVQRLRVAAARDRDDPEERAPPAHGAAEIIPSASSREAPLGYSAKY
jgi:hypothetical protein